LGPKGKVRNDWGIANAHVTRASRKEGASLGIRMFIGTLRFDGAVCAYQLQQRPAVVQSRGIGAVDRATTRKKDKCKLLKKELNASNPEFSKHDPGSR